MAMALTRCQYQQHDFAHGQFNKLKLFNNNFMKNIFLLTTGISVEYWNNEEHMPHHINVNNFEFDPDDFKTRIKSNWGWRKLTFDDFSIITNRLIDNFLFNRLYLIKNHYNIR
jgi:fatty acid desaturase